MMSLIQSGIQAASSMLIEKLSRTVINYTVEKVAKETKTFVHKILVEPNATRSSIQHHSREMHEWCSRVSHKGMHQSVPLSEVFVELKLNNDPRRFRMGTDQQTVVASRPLRSKSNLLFVGDLGSGKTTLLQKFALEKWSRDGDEVLMFLRFRDFSETDSIYENITAILCVKFEQAEIDPKDAKRFTFEKFDILKLRALAALCDQLQMTLVLDGLDEAPRTRQEFLQDEIDNLSRYFKKTRIIFTSRPSDVTRTFAKFTVFEIEAFDESTVSKFTGKWYSHHETKATAKKLKEDFLRELKRVPYADISSRPLMLTNLCIIFQKYKSLPPRPASIYNKMINLFLEEWDAQRGVRRQSRYAVLDTYFKIQFLSYFAFSLMVKSNGKMVFDRGLCEEIYSEIHEAFGLPSFEYREVVDDIESTTGIVVRSTYDQYEFCHKSIYEYLVAEYIVRSGVGAFDYKTLELCPNESAVAVALSSSPDVWIKDLFYNDGKPVRRDPSWIKTFLHRLNLEKPSIISSGHLSYAAICMFIPLQGAPVPSEYSNFLKEASTSKALTRYFGELKTSVVGDILTVEMTLPGKSDSIELQFKKKPFLEQFGRFI